jgi:hypothetical protein
MLIAVSAILSVAVFSSSISERGSTPVTTPEVAPIVGVTPVDGE